MRGKPKFKVGDKVRFKFEEDELEGVVYIVDKWGTFNYPEDVSYDIYVESNNTLYKHFTEKLVSPIENNEILTNS